MQNNPRPEPPKPDHVPDAKWRELPDNLRRQFWVIAAQLLVGFQRGHGVEEGRRRAHRTAYLQVARRDAWIRRPEEAKPCPKGCGTPLLWRMEPDHYGRHRAVGFAQEPAGQEHACPADHPLEERRGA